MASFRTASSAEAHQRDALLIRSLVPKLCVSLELVAESFVRLQTQDEPDE